MKRYRSFKQYLKDNHPWGTVLITLFSVGSGLYSIDQQVYMFTAIVGASLTLLWLGSYIDWKKNG